VDLAVEPGGSGARWHWSGTRPSVTDDLTVAENVRFVARSTGHTRDDADGALERVGLTRVANVSHGRLSQGQRRRLSLANALARASPRLLLLDEPTPTRRARRAVLEEVVRAAPADGCTVLLASHELELARGLATREVRSSPTGAPDARARSAGSSRGAGCNGCSGCVRGRGPHMTFLRDALLVAGKDLRIERRSRVALQQIVPFGPSSSCSSRSRSTPTPRCCARAAPGLFWAAVLLAVLLAVGRSFSIEEANRARDGLRLSGLDGGSIFLGKAAAVAVRAVLLEVIVGATVVVLYDVSVRGVVVLLCAAVAATLGLAPPVRFTACWPEDCARARRWCHCSCCRPSCPVMLGATRSFQLALAGTPGDAWPWVQLLIAFAVLAVAAGTVAFGPLLEEA